MGRKTKDGMVLRLEFDDSKNCAIVYAGYEKFLSLHFWYKKNIKYDPCTYTTTYNLNEQVLYYNTNLLPTMTWVTIFKFCVIKIWHIT